MKTRRNPFLLYLHALEVEDRALAEALARALRRGHAPLGRQLSPPCSMASPDLATATAKRLGSILGLTEEPA